MSTARGHYNPDDIHILVEAFELALGEAGLANPTCTLAQFVAENIIDAAQEGENNIVVLRQEGVRAVAALLVDGKPETTGTRPIAGGCDC